MRWSVSALVTAECLLDCASGWRCCALLAPQMAYGSIRSGVATSLKRRRCASIRHQLLLYNQVDLHPQQVRTIVMIDAGAGPNQGPDRKYNRAAWQRRARRAMKYVSMPMKSVSDQPREQILIALSFPVANKTVNFVFDTLRRRTLITPRAREELRISDGPGVGDHPDHGACVQLPAARIGHEHGNHFMVVIDAVVGNPEQVRLLGPNTGGVLGLDFLNKYDLDLNFKTREARFYATGAVDQGLMDTSRLEGLACGYLPGGKLGIKMELNGGGRFTGVLDLASNTTAGNWLAARDLDVTAIAQGQASSYPRETGRSRPLMCAHFDTVQLGHVLLTSVMDAKNARDGHLAVYVGHLPEFDSIAQDISSEPRGRQLALVGQDLIAHSRVVLSCRSKRLYFAPLEANDVWAGQVV